MALIDNILDLATMQAGQMVLELVALDAAHILRDTADRARDWAVRFDIAVELDCPPGLGFIRADEQRIRQAMNNLVSNAIKFTRAGGVVTIAGILDNGWLGLRVSDTGIGIPIADQARVFEKFERQGTQRGENTGAGLGLALVKGFVEMHGGRVELHSEPMRGTEVTCWLKALVHEGPRLVPLDPPAPERKGAVHAAEGVRQQESRV
jgi:signal transduction histidine kinase